MIKKINRFRVILGFLGISLMTACASNDPYYAESTSPNNYPVAQQYPAASNTLYSGYGTVHSIELIRENSATGPGVGAVAGAVVGGVVGNQVGDSTAATVLGAAGGAFVGHQIEKQNRQGADVYLITIRMSNGGYQTLRQYPPMDWRVGDRIRITNGVIERY